MKTKNQKSPKSQLKRGKKGGKSIHHKSNAIDFVEEDYINPLETSPRIFENSLLR